MLYSMNFVYVSVDINVILHYIAAYFEPNFLDFGSQVAAEASGVIRGIQLGGSFSYRYVVLLQYNGVNVPHPSDPKYWIFLMDTPYFLKRIMFRMLN